MGGNNKGAPRRRLDGRVKEVTEDALAHILRAHPNAEVIERDGERIVQIPMYDINTDRSWVEERKVKPSPDGTSKFRPGDVLRHTKTGVPFSIVDPLRAFLKIRRGSKSED